MLRFAAAVAVAFVLVGGAVTAAHAARPLARSDYFGVRAVFTETDVTFISFRTSRSRLRLRDGFFSVSSPCSNGRSYAANFDLSGVRIRRNGAFRAERREDLDVQAFTDRSSVQLAGRFRRNGRVARIRYRARAEGGRGVSCDSGTRTISARVIGGPRRRGGRRDPSFTG